MLFSALEAKRRELYPTDVFCTGKLKIFTTQTGKDYTQKKIKYSQNKSSIITGFCLVLVAIEITLDGKVLIILRARFLLEGLAELT